LYLIAVTSEPLAGEVREIVIATVLTENDMLDVKDRKWEVCLLEPTIFTARSCAATDHSTDGGVY